MRLAVSIALAVLALSACDRSPPNPDKPSATQVSDKPKRFLSIAEVEARLEAGDIVIVDGNDEASRREAGVIEGAVLLTAPGNISALPKDRDTALVFYCWDHG